MGRRLVTLAMLVVACFISLSSSTAADDAPQRAGASRRCHCRKGRLDRRRRHADHPGRRRPAQHRIRLFGIDAPEKSQAFGNQSKKNLAEKVFGETVRVEVVDIDRYGREVGRIYLGDRFINLEQVRDGLRLALHRRSTVITNSTRPKPRPAKQRRGLWADSASHAAVGVPPRTPTRNDDGVNSPRRVDRLSRRPPGWAWSL